MINRCGEIFHININTNNPSCQYVSKNIIYNENRFVDANYFLKFSFEKKNDPSFQLTNVLISQTNVCFYERFGYYFNGVDGQHELFLINGRKKINPPIQWHFENCFQAKLYRFPHTLLSKNIIGRITFEYTEVKTMMQDEDHERLRKDEINLERSLNKIIPDFFSYWTIAYGIIMVGAAFGLIKIQ